MDRAKEFYEGKLGLTAWGDDPDGGRTYLCGEQSTLHVFPSPSGAGASQATVAGWTVNDLEAVVDELRRRALSSSDMTSRRSAPTRRASRSSVKHQGRLVQGPGRQHPRPHPGVGSRGRSGSGIRDRADNHQVALNPQAPEIAAVAARVVPQWDPRWDRLPAHSRVACISSFGAFDRSVGAWEIRACCVGEAQPWPCAAG